MTPALSNRQTTYSRYGFRAVLGLFLAFLGLSLGVSSKASAASGVVCEAIFAGYAGKGLGIIDSMIKRGSVSEDVARRIIHTSNGQGISWDLFEQKKITAAELDVLYFTFMVIERAQALEPAEKVKALGTNPSRPEVFIQQSEASFSHERLDVYDVKMEKNLGSVSYSIERSHRLTIDLIRVPYTERQNHYSELLVQETLRRHPEVQQVKAQLAGTNLERLMHGTDIDVPLYRTLVKYGFKAHVYKSVDGDNYWIEAVRK